MTGELDQETLAMMERPRCGVKDVLGHGAGREKRYALQGGERFYSSKVNLTISRVTLASSRSHLPNIKISNQQLEKERG